MKVGVIADTHFPFEDRRYFDFVRRTFDRLKVEHVVHIGDLIDLYHCSRFTHDPNKLEGSREMDKAIRRAQKWYAEWPEMDICWGNHEKRLSKRAEEGGILTDLWLRSFNEVLGTPTWNWGMEHFIDGVLYTHGEGRGGITGARLLALDRGSSVVMGHTHRYAAVHFIAQQGRRRTMFGMNVGMGVDKKSYAFRYATDTGAWVHACGAVLDGNPIVVPM
jgi:predicted phosphodiesterase